MIKSKQTKLKSRPMNLMILFYDLFHFNWFGKRWLCFFLHDLFLSTLLCDKHVLFYYASPLPALSAYLCDILDPREGSTTFLLATMFIHNIPTRYKTKMQEHPKFQQEMWSFNNHLIKSVTNIFSINHHHGMAHTTCNTTGKKKYNPWVELLKTN